MLINLYLSRYDAFIPFSKPQIYIHKFFTISNKKKILLLANVSFTLTSFIGFWYPKVGRRPRPNFLFKLVHMWAGKTGHAAGTEDDPFFEMKLIGCMVPHCSPSLYNL